MPRLVVSSPIVTFVHARSGVRKVHSRGPLLKIHSKLEPEHRAAEETTSQSEELSKPPAMAEEEDHTISRFFATHTVAQSSIDHFSKVPFLAPLLQDPAYVAIPTFSRVLKPTGEDAFFSCTINTLDTIPEALCIRLRELPVVPMSGQEDRTAYTTNPYASVVPEKPDVVLLMSLARPGLDGHPATLHGGMATALLDEAIGLCVMLHQTHVSDPRSAMFTARLETAYRRPVPTPGEVAVRTWLVRREGRKWWARGQIVDKDGVVMTEAEGLWIEARTRGKL